MATIITIQATFLAMIGVRMLAARILGSPSQNFMMFDSRQLLMSYNIGVECRTRDIKSKKQHLLRKEQNHYYRKHYSPVLDCPMLDNFMLK